MTVSLVLAPDVAALWPRISQHIMAGIGAGAADLYDEWSLKKGCISGEMGLWVVHEDDLIRAAAITRLNDYPKGRICLVLTCGGEGVEEWVLPLRDAIGAHAARMGASALEAWGRNGWLRLCGGKEVSRVMRWEIGQ